MKKFFLAVVLVLIAAYAVSAQNYTVHSVSGRVEREAGASRVEVIVGETIGSDTVIITGIGASLVLFEGDRSFTVSGARNGKVSELTASGLRIGSAAAEIDTDEIGRTSAQTSTASARASDAASFEDIAAE